MQGKLARVALLDARSSIFFSIILKLICICSRQVYQCLMLLRPGFVCHKRVFTKSFCKELDKEDARFYSGIYFRNQISLVIYFQIFNTTVYFLHKMFFIRYSLSGKSFDICQLCCCN